MSGSASKLTALTKALSSQWQQTKECWKDAKCEEFERKYIQELTAGVDRAVTVIEQLDKLITKIRKDCE
ncbi:MAG TPA: hypothetical protein VEO53_07880 [Candidatus Binatia bacterium]|nr:hypothetical protein [Candidatus Binatia bacterium]